MAKPSTTRMPSLEILAWITTAATAAIVIEVLHRQLGARLGYVWEMLLTLPLILILQSGIFFMYRDHAAPMIMKAVLYSAITGLLRICVSAALGELTWGLAGAAALMLLAVVVAKL